MPISVSQAKKGADNWQVVTWQEWQEWQEIWKLAATTRQQTKFQKSCHSCQCCHEKVKLKEIHFLCYTLNFINIVLMEDMLKGVDEKNNLSTVSFDANQPK